MLVLHCLERGMDAVVEGVRIAGAGALCWCGGAKMKNFWTEQTVNRNAGRAGFANVHEYLLAKQHEFEARTGVKWSVSHQHGGYTFDPVDEGVAIPVHVAAKVVQDVKDAYERAKETFGGYATYLDVHEASGLGLRQVMGVVRFMERVGDALRTVNRMGKAHAFKLKGWGYTKMEEK